MSFRSNAELIRAAVRRACKRHDVSEADVMGGVVRHAPVVSARHEAIHEVRTTLCLSEPQIAKRFNLDASTVHYAIHKMAKIGGSAPVIQRRKRKLRSLTIWTEDKVSKLIECASSGVTLKATASIVGMTEQQCSDKLKKLRSQNITDAKFRSDRITKPSGQKKGGADLRLGLANAAPEEGGKVSYKPQCDDLLAALRKHEKLPASINPGRSRTVVYTPGYDGPVYRSSAAMAICG